jgi:hypothetical protein
LDPLAGFGRGQMGERGHLAVAPATSRCRDRNYYYRGGGRGFFGIHFNYEDDSGGILTFTFRPTPRQRNRFRAEDWS